MKNARMKKECANNLLGWVFHAFLIDEVVSVNEVGGRFMELKAYF